MKKKLLGLFIILFFLGCGFTMTAVAKDSLEKRIENLEHELARLQAVNEIQNLMARYEICHNHTLGTKMTQLFSKRPDTWVEIADKGVSYGLEHIQKKSEKGSGKPGVMFEHPLSTPLVVVARDGKTAKGVWWSLGQETYGDPPVAHWCYGKYAVDFIKEDGEWKIWHQKWFRVFKTTFDTAWTDRERASDFIAEDYVFPAWIDEPSRYHQPYFPDVMAVTLPPSPQPYDTWTEKDEGWMFIPGTKP